jgi:hypothetical protein
MFKELFDRIKDDCDNWERVKLLFVEMCLEKYGRVNRVCESDEKDELYEIIVKYIAEHEPSVFGLNIERLPDTMEEQMKERIEGHFMEVQTNEDFHAIWELIKEAGSAGGEGVASGPDFWAGDFQK